MVMDFMLLILLRPLGGWTGDDHHRWVCGTCKEQPVCVCLPWPGGCGLLQLPRARSHCGAQLGALWLQPWSHLGVLCKTNA